MTVSQSIDLVPFIDHTALAATVTDKQIVTLYREAEQWGFSVVCIPPCFVSLCQQMQDGLTKPLICTVIGFPLGYNDPAAKAKEAQLAVQNGALELDVVMNIPWFKSCQYDRVKGDLKQVLEILPPQIVCKVIIETPLLNENEIARAAELVYQTGAHFVKSGTGFAGAVKIRDIDVIFHTIGRDLGIKAAGGIKTFAMAQALIKAGATRLGTSASVQLVCERNLGVV